MKLVLPMPVPVKSRRPWSQDEDEALRSLYPTRNSTELGLILGRTSDSIRKRCALLALNYKMQSPGYMWSQAEDDVLRSLYLSHKRSEIAQILGRTYDSVRARCFMLGLNQKLGFFTQAETDIVIAWYQRRDDLMQEDFSLHSLAKLLGRTIAGVEKKAITLGLTRKGNKGQKSDMATRRQLSVRQKEYHATHEHPRGALGMHHSAETRAAQSACSKAAAARKTAEQRSAIAQRAVMTRLAKYGTGNPGNRGQNPYSRTRGGKRADLGGLFVRSSWEANYARYLNYLVAQGQIEKWEYEPQTFVFHGVTRGVLTYTPDFRITELDGTIMYHEVKGWMDAKSKAKLARMSKFYPDVKLIVIGPFEYKAIGEYRRLVEGWED